MASLKSHSILFALLVTVNQCFALRHRDTYIAKGRERKREAKQINDTYSRSSTWIAKSYM